MCEGGLPLEVKFECLCSHIESDKQQQVKVILSAVKLNENEIIALAGHLELPLTKPNGDLLIRLV